MDILVRPVREEELDKSDFLCRLAFGTQYGLTNPLQTFGDRDMIASRWRGSTSIVLVAEVEGTVSGITAVTRWGSLGFFGRMAVHPQLWGKGVASRLVERADDLFEQWHVSQAGLVTQPESPKHVHLYQKFGFWPRYLTAMMSKPVKPNEDSLAISTFSALEKEEKRQCIEQTFHLSNSIYSGLDLSTEIQSVYSQAFGDTILLWDDHELTGFAICHCGPRTEAGTGNCYVKFGAVKPSPNRHTDFERLLKTCEAFAVKKRLMNIVAGMNTERHEAYRTMIENRFITSTLYVTMHKPNEPAYNRSNVFVMDWWS